MLQQFGCVKEVNIYFKITIPIKTGFKKKKTDTKVFDLGFNREQFLLSLSLSIPCLDRALKFLIMPYVFSR